MSTFDKQDMLILHHAVDTLDQHAIKELAEARRKGGNTAAKQMALTVLRQRIATVRNKLKAMEQAT